MVEFKDVSKVYDSRVFAINNVNFKVDSGEFVFLIGPSGSGKTTIIKMLIRDEIPSEGKIIFDERDITKINRESVYKLRREIGVIFQDYKLVQEKTAYENVAFAMEAAGKKNSEIKETVPYVLDIVGLSGRMNAFPRQLSGGEQQRVTIARAIANNPKILIADEPTGNLDPASAWDIVQILSKINNWGTTVIMSTHGTDIVNALNKRVIQMANGSIIRDDKGGTYDQTNLDYEEKFKEESANDTQKVVEHPKSTFKLKLGVDEEKEEVKEEVPEVKKESKILGIFSRLKRQPVTVEEPEETKEEAKEEKAETKKEAVDESKLFLKMDNREQNLAQKIEEDKEVASSDEEVQVSKDVKVTNQKAKEWIESAKKTPVSKLNLPKEVIKDLKVAGYRYVEEIIEDGPDELRSSKMIDPDEVVQISKEIIKFLEEQKNK